MRSLKRLCAYRPLRGLDDGLRRLLGGMDSDYYVQRLFEALRGPFEKLFPLEFSEKLVPVETASGQTIGRFVKGCLTFMEMEAQIFLAENVMGRALADSKGGGRVILDKSVIESSLSEGAFLLVRCLEYLKSGNALLTRLAFDDRLLLTEILTGLLQNPEHYTDLVQEFRRGLSRRHLSAVDKIVEEYLIHRRNGGSLNQPVRWLEDIERLANQVALIACDDISAALKVLGWLTGPELSRTFNDPLAFLLIPEAPKLIQFFFSDMYTNLRSQLANS
jgi:hypothetical protein